MKRQTAHAGWSTYLLAAMLIILMIPSSTLAQETKNGLQYQVDKNQNVTITGYHGNADVEIPSIIEGMPVTAIGDSSFMKNEVIKSIIIPEGVKKIGNNAFADNSMLEKVAIPKSVAQIAQDAFEDCGKVTIWGFYGSHAEKFANKNPIPFILITPTKEIRLTHNDYNVSNRKRYINIASEITTLQLSAKTSPENPWSGVTWKSSNAKVASVDANGLVTGLKKGKTTITATAIDKSGIKAFCEINVANLVNEIIVSGETTILSGKKITLSATVLPDIADNKKITWKSSNDDIATVNGKGVVTAKKVKKEKTVIITATATDGSKVQVQYPVAVLP